jgi:N-acetylmuramoyl-L-alanine amidase
MLKKFFELFSNFFSSLFGGKKSTPTSKPSSDPSPYDKLPDLVEDSSDVPRDTVITVKENEIDKFKPIGDPAIEPPFADPDKEDAIDKPGTTTGGTTIGGTTTKPEPGPGDGDQPSTGGTTTPTSPKPTHKARYLWCLDNGHGKLQPGKRSPIFDDGTTRFFEYEFNRDLVERIMKALDKKGVKYYDVVPDYLEVGSFLEERVDRANKKKSDLPKIYVSVHANAGPAPDDKWVSSTIKGIETWFAANSQKGKKIAAIFQKHLVDKTGFKNRNLKSTAEKSLYVLSKTIMPAVLTENGFYNNKEEVMELMKDDVRQKIADAHVDAIMEIEKNGI